MSSKNIYALCHLLTEKLFVNLEHQTIDHQSKGEDTVASIEKTEHVYSVILIKFVTNSTLYSNVIPFLIYGKLSYRPTVKGGGPRIVVSTAALHARVRGSVPGLGGLKETKMFLPHPRLKVSIVGSLRDREVACSASDRQGSISNPVSGGQCHLTILRRFSWPSLAYMCTKVA